MLVKVGFSIRFCAFLSFFILISFSSFAQGVPRNFNYQAVARDENGYPIVDRNIVIEITIRGDAEAGEVVWQETHYKKTNEFGLFNLLIGSGVSTSVGSIGKFTSINWAKRDYFIQTRVDFGAEQFGNGLLNMGIAKLSSVPYALLADSVMKLPPIKLTLGQLTDVDLTGLLKDNVIKWSGQKWVVGDAMTGDFITTDGLTDLKGDWTIADKNVTLLSGILTTNGLRAINFKLGSSPLIELISKDTTLGGNLTADNVVSTQKAVKKYVDNFMADGSWTKEGNYLYNLDNFIGVGIKTPLDKFHAEVGTNSFLVTGDFDGLTIPNMGAGTRMVFYPRKAAFRVGHLSGPPSGPLPGTPSGPLSAQSEYWYDQNVGNYSSAMGKDVKASGDCSFAVGLECKAVGINSVALGLNNSALGNHSFCAGNSNTASGSQSIALGKNNNSSGVTTVTIGEGNSAAGIYSVAIGHLAQVATSGSSAIAFGESTIARGAYSLVAGRLSVTNGDYSASIGFSNTSNGNGSFAAGAKTKTNGNFSGAIGYGLATGSFSEFAVGTYNNNLIVTNSSKLFDVKDRVFIVGNGKDSLNRSDAFVVMKSGFCGIGKSIANSALDVVGNITATGTITSSSDLRFKKNILKIDNALERTLALCGVNYNWKVDEFKEKKFSSSKQIGFIAQEIETVFPELVLTDVDGYKSVDYSRLTAVLVEAIKEQQKIIANLNLKVKDTDNKVDRLSEQFSVLNQRIEVLEMLVKATVNTK